MVDCVAVFVFELSSAAASSAVVVALEMSANLTGDGTDESGDVA